MRLYTIGFTKKSAEDFFGLLKKNNIKTVLDIRLNNSNQLAGFSKSRDLKYFLSKILNVNYIEDFKFAPTKEILDDYKKNVITWEEYKVRYNQLLEERNIIEYINKKYSNNFDGVCLLCSESEASKCHRRLAAEFIKKTINDQEIRIIHL